MGDYDIKFTPEERQEYNRLYALTREEKAQWCEDNWCMKSKKMTAKEILDEKPYATIEFVEDLLQILFLEKYNIGKEKQ